VCLEVKSVGKPCAGKPHARFDERGWETKLWHRLRHRLMTKVAGNSYSLMPKTTEPIFDSTNATKNGGANSWLFSGVKTNVCWGIALAIM